MMVSTAIAKHEYPYRKGTVRHRLSIAPVKSFYKNHTEHTINTTGKTGLNLGYTAEYFFGENVNLLFGLGFMAQRFSFQGYFDAPGYTFVYDESYAYTHTVKFQEVNLPIGLKYAFISEEDNYFSPYATAGLSIRYIVHSKNLIMNDSSTTEVYDDSGTLSFENNIGKMRALPDLKNLNGYFFFGLGGQYNFRGSAKSIFLELNYKFGLSRLHYKGYNDSNNLFIKNSNLSFTIGVRI